MGDSMQNALAGEMIALVQSWSAATGPRSINSRRWSTISCAGWRGSYMQNESPARTMQATALVHEAYLRLANVTNIDLNHRGQFFAVTSRIMRNILLDEARTRLAAKRGGRQERVNLTEIPDGADRAGSDLLALDEALRALAVADARKAQVIELRFFGGLSVEDTAAALGISPETVMRDVKAARAWLKREISGRSVSRASH